MSSPKILSAFQLNLVKMCLDDGLVVFLHPPKEGVKWDYCCRNEGFSLTIQAGATHEEENIGSRTVVIEAMTGEDYQALEKQLSGCLGVSEALDDGVLVWE
jgi:hypothetical protein